MADRYLDSEAASPAQPYDTTDSAAPSAMSFDVGAIEADLAVDETIWVKATHSFSTSVAQILTSSPNASASAPQRLICVSDFGTNTALVTAPSAQERCSANATITIEGFWYIHGLQFFNSSALGGGLIQFGGTTTGPHNITANMCRLSPANNTGATVALGNIGNASNDETQISLTNCVFAPRHAGNHIALRHGQHRISNLSLAGDSEAICTSVFGCGLNGVSFDVRIENSDLTGLAITNLFSSNGNPSGVLRVRNVKVPAGTVLCTDDITAPSLRFLADDITIGTTYVPFYRRYYEGEVKHETTILVDDAATRLYLRDDQSESYSIKLQGNTLTSYWQPLYSDWIHINVEDTATAITPYAEILVSGDGAAALTDRECWLEVDAKTVAGTNNHEAERYNDASSLVAAGTAQAAGTITWTGHGYSSPRTHKLALGSSITPTQKGYIRVRVALAKAATVYVGKVGV